MHGGVIEEDTEMRLLREVNFFNAKERYRTVIILLFSEVEDMATSTSSLFCNQERVQVLEPQNLTSQLALAVRRIHWSYAIFWNISATQPGVLKWTDGYYNGDIKTRKIVQSMEPNADRLDLQRSEQLKELFEFLSTGESISQAKRPSAALSPEDLSDTEWYYVVCMSYSFGSGQGLAGRTLANGKPTWLCNAHSADTKFFTRSLLAKSASIQTVVCFPFFSGVVELGNTEQVLEDPSLIQHIKTSFLEIPCPTVVDKSTAENDVLFDSAAVDCTILNSTLIPFSRCEQLNVASAVNDSDDAPLEDSIIVEGLHGGTCPAESWQLMDDDFTDCCHHSINSSDCVSQIIEDPVNTAAVPIVDQANEPCIEGFEGCDTKLTAVDLINDDLNYTGVVSCVLKTSHPLVLGPYLQNRRQESSFVRWKKARLPHSVKLKGITPQKVLKMMLFEVPLMHFGGVLESLEDVGTRVGVSRPEVDDIGASHVLSEWKRREKLNKRFSILKSVLPSIDKTDKVSILDNTIGYLLELQKRVEELESYKDSIEVDARTRKTPKNVVERTSEKYGTSRSTCGAKKTLSNNRKACDSRERETAEMVCGASKDNVAVVTKGDDVLIKIKTRWRDGILIEIMDIIRHFHLDSHSVQSTTKEGILYLTVKSKVKGLTAASAATIKQALQRVIRKNN